MLITVWIVSGFLALAYLFAGGAKVLIGYDKVQERMTWTSHSKPWVVKVVGSLEVLGAIGLILPALTGILPILTPVAAVAFVAIQVVAIVIHLRTGEGKKIGMNVLLLLLALFVAIARFAGV